MTRVLWLAVLVCVVQCLPMSQDELEDFSNFLLKTSSLDIHVKSTHPDDAFDEDEVVSDHAWEESGKFEGDLILNDRQRRLIVENVEGLSRNGLTDSTKRWPNNEVIYFIQREHFTSGQVQAIQAGIDDLAQASCVKFKPYRKGDRDAVVIQGSRRGCFSQVGYQGGYQVLNLSGRHPVGRGCFRHGTVVHELLHSLGFYHMQSSPDRDDYINVVWANIVQPARHNFRKYNSFSVSDFGVGYDYDSVLHYSRRAFSANGQDTLIPKKSGAEIGQRLGLSDKDSQKLNKMYCDADNDPAVQADETTSAKPKNKKKKPKNQPFEGHGIGYHQGKTMVIKLPAAETYKLPNVPSTPVFDFSKTPQVVPPEAEGYRFGEEITYSYNPITSLSFDKVKDYDKPEIKSIGEEIIYSYKPISSLNIDKIKGYDKPEIQLKGEEMTYSYKPISSPNIEKVKDYDKPETKSSGEEITYSYKPITSLNIDKANDYDIPEIKPIGEEITYSYKPIISHKHKTQTNKVRDYEIPENKPFININTEHRHDIKEQADPPKENKDRHSLPQHSNEVKPEYVPIDDYDKDLKEAFDRLNKIVKQHVYPQNKGYYHKLNKDYDKFFTPLEHQESESPNHYLDDKFKQPISHSLSTIIPLKQIDITQTSDNKFRNNQIQDRMDASFETAVSTKKPYSAYEQTETPVYATLEYLKNRHDFSKLYSPVIPDGSEESDESISAENDKYKEEIKINPYDRGFYTDHVSKNSEDRSTEAPILENVSEEINDSTDNDKDDIKINLYDRGFYTDYVNKNSKSRSTEAPTLENVSKEIKPGKYKLQKSPKQLQFVEGIDSSYTRRTLLPIKKPYSAYEQTDTPIYATLEYLKDRHDISNIYPQKIMDRKNTKGPYTISGDEHPPTEDDWYTKDSYRQNPANYDRNSFSDYVRPKHKEHDEYDSSDEDDKSSKNSLNKTIVKNKPESDVEDYYSDYENGKLTTVGNFNKGKDKALSKQDESKHGTKHNNYDYYGKYQKDENDQSSNEDDEKIKESPNHPHNHELQKFNQDYSTVYEKDHDTSTVEGSNEDENREKEPPKKSIPYTLYGVPVPLTKGWYKINYKIPEISKTSTSNTY